MIIYHIKGLYKITCHKTKSNFSQFFFSRWVLRKCYFSFLIKMLANFEQLIRFHWQAFIVYKNGENLKMLIEIFCQKLIVCNVILVFNLKFSSLANHGDRHSAPPFFKISGSAPAIEDGWTYFSRFYFIKSYFIHSDMKLLQYIWLHIKNNARFKYMKCLFPNIQKQ